MYNHRSLIQSVPPASEPVSVATAMAWCRVVNSAEEPIIASLISAAREFCETFTGRQMMPATYQASWDRFPMLPNMQYAPGNPNAVVPTVNNMWPLNPGAWAMLLPMPPLISVVSLDYIDADGNPASLEPVTDFVVDTASSPGRLTPSTGSFWPETSFMPGAVTVTYQAGYTSQVPYGIIQAIKSLVSYWYDNREAVIVAPSIKVTEAPLGVKTLLWQHRVLADQ